MITSSTNGSQDTTFPTIVLVHGAFAESSSWNGVIGRLRDHGYEPIAVPNPLRSVATDADVVASVVRAIEGPVVLVGHSYGGAIITNAVRDNQNVTALVYVAGFAPDEGENIGELSGRFPGSTLADTLWPVALSDGTTDLFIRQDHFHQQFAADVDAAEATLMAATQRPLRDVALHEGSGQPAWKTLPSWFIFGDLDRNIPAAAQRFMAERAKSRETVEMPGVSHAIGVSQPDAVADIILRAAQESAATTREPLAMQFD